MRKAKALKKKLLSFFLVMVMVLLIIPAGAFTAYAAEDDGYYKIYIDTGGKGNVTLSVPSYIEPDFITMPETNMIYINKDLLENTYTSWDLGSCLQYVTPPEAEGYIAGDISDRGFAFVNVDPSTLTDWESYYASRNATSDAEIADFVDESGKATVYINWFQELGSMGLAVTAPLCGDTVAEDTVPDVKAADGYDWEFEDTRWLVVEKDEYDTYYIPYIGHVTGGEKYTLGVEFYAPYGYYLDPNMRNGDFTVSYTDAFGEELTANVIDYFILYEGFEADYNYIICEVEAQHVPDEEVIENNVDPSCLDKGSYEKVIYCEKCKEELSREKVEVDALGHDWGEWIVTKEPEIGVEGERQRTCKRCGLVEKESIPALIAYTVTFESNGGSEVDPQTVLEGETAEKPEDPTQDGYYFTAWCMDDSLTEEYDFETPVTEDITLYAMWTIVPPVPTTFTITYELNGGTLDGQTGTIEIEVEEGTEITLPKPERDGYTFDYWKGSKYEAGASYTVEGDHTFTAQWISNSDIPPKTGDSSHVNIWITLLVLSTMGLCGTILAGKKRRHVHKR